MSRERARRRAEREAAAALVRAHRERQRARRERWDRLRERILRPLARSRPRRRPDSVLQRRHRRQNGVVLAVLFAGHVVLWLLQPSWLWRGSVLVLTVLAWPALTVLLFDRRSSR
ncbi:MAG TPA: hypothetical protein VFP72_09580 [Kineosporiaceae bacterium]|nr:hypothetical protein [Kineosporiaceae bacterium]